MLLFAVMAVTAFQTGNDLQYSCIRQDHCIAYVVGAVDAWDDSFIAFRSKLFCTPAGLTQGQAADIFAHFLDTHPEKRHLAAADLVLSAMMDAFPCSKPHRHSARKR